MSLEDLRMGFEELPSELGVPRGQRPLLRRHGPGKLCLSHRRRPEGWPTPTLPPTHPSRPNNHQLQAQYRPQYTQHNITVQYSAGCTHTTPNPRHLGLGPKSKIHSGGGGAITARVFAAVTKLNFRECWRGDKGHHSGSGRAGVPGRFRRKPVLPVASCRLTGFLKGTVQVHAPRCRSQVMSLEDLRMGFEELPSELGVPRGQRPLLRRHGPGKLCLSHRRRPEGWPTPTLTRTGHRDPTDQIPAKSRRPSGDASRSSGAAKVH